MTIENAIETAIKYEKRVHEVYLTALAENDEPTAKKVFELMAREEEGHVAYLESKLASYRAGEALSSDDLETELPPAKDIESAVAGLLEKVSGGTQGRKVKALEKAFEVEKETSIFYKELVETLPPEGKRFFERFLEIEEGHVALVQAEIDAMRGSGFWFDVTEFDLEGA